MISSKPFIQRTELIQSIHESVVQSKGFAMGKLGFSEQCLLGYLPFKRKDPTSVQLKAYEAMLRYHCENQFGVFPTDEDFLQEFAHFYLPHILQLDILGLFQAEQEEKIIKDIGLQARFIPYQLTEPDRSIPADDSNCYLRYFNGKKLLFISPFSDLLKSRARKEVFEQVWSNIQKKWFYPWEVHSIEIPYSYGSSTQTHQKYHNSINLFDAICEKMETTDFDVALIGAGALGLPLASYIKKQGKIAISLGGHLQVLFGIGGGRWNRDEFFKSHYINNAWIEMPEKYHPENRTKLTDDSAYW